MKNTGWLVLLVVVWIGALSAGFASLWRHAETPGVAAQTRPDWPAQSKIPRDGRRATLLVFSHPKCPCTQASLHELERVLASEGLSVNCYVIFERPVGTPQDWTHTALRREAERIAGIQVREDNGREAKLFDASTSGQTLLYDTEGRLRFEGGLTESRGHEGDNTGEDVVLALLRGTRSSLTVVRTPVFGCSFR